MSTTPEGFAGMEDRNPLLPRLIMPLAAARGLVLIVSTVLFDNVRGSTMKRASLQKRNPNKRRPGWRRRKRSPCSRCLQLRIYLWSPFDKFQVLSALTRFLSALLSTLRVLWLISLDIFATSLAAFDSANLDPLASARGKRRAQN